MCGIVGLISKSKFGFYKAEADLFVNMLRMDGIRGEDSTGVFGVTQSGKLDYIKGDTDGYTFTRCQDYTKWHNRITSSYHIIVGHNRKATKGSITPQNAHPFVKDHICLVHNGTIWNSKDLNDDVEVDSEAVAHSLAEHNAPAALKKLNGAFALVWFNKKDGTLSLVRNNQRTLHLIEYDNYWVISSEIGLPLWLQGRENKKALSLEQTLLPTDKILVFNLQNLSKKPEEIGYEEYKFYQVPSSYSKVSHVPMVRAKAYNQAEALSSRLPALLQGQQAFKAGDPVKFKLLPISDHDPNARVLLGHPIFGKDLDENFTVQTVIPKGTKLEDFCAQGSIYTATVVNLRPVAGKWVVFTRDPVVVRVVTDAHGTEHNVPEVIEALKKGCGRCFHDMFFRDLGKSIAHKKKNGDWRLLCHNCYAESLKNAKRDNVIVLPTSQGSNLVQ